MSSDYLTLEQRQLLKQLFREHVQKTGATVTDLSILLDVSRTTAKNWMEGRSSPTKANRERIAKEVFGMSPTALEVRLFGGKVEVEKSHEDILAAIKIAPIDLFLEIRELVFQRETEEIRKQVESQEGVDEDDFDV